VGWVPKYAVAVSSKLTCSSEKVALLSNTGRKNTGARGSRLSAPDPVREFRRQLQCCDQRPAGSSNAFGCALGPYPR